MQEFPAECSGTGAKNMGDKFRDEDNNLNFEYIDLEELQIFSI